MSPTDSTAETLEAAVATATPGSKPVPRSPNVGFMLRHPAHGMALGFGSGLSKWAPGTVGTLWAWLTFSVAAPWLQASAWAWVLVVSSLAGWWACTVTARNLGLADPGAIVWDEVVAFWLVLWILTPASFTTQLLAFGLFRFFDAVKPGPVAWADALLKDSPQPALRGLGILGDDFVAAGCALLVVALLVFVGVIAR
jgi:phosphatidylglycerophosphatase A